MLSNAARRYLFWLVGVMLMITIGMGLGAHKAFAGPPEPSAGNAPSSIRESNTVPAAPNATDTPTPTSTPNCPQNYNITQFPSGTSVPGTTLVPGSQCDDCEAPVTLPFTYTFYGQNFSAASVTDNGQLAFSTPVDHSFTNYCLPDPNPSSYVIFAYWRDLSLDATTGGLQQCLDIGCGVYTSVSGSTPNRIFNQTAGPIRALV